MLEQKTLNREAYKWFYDNVHCHYYNLLMKYCFLPFGGETKCREELIAHVDFSPRDRIFDMCCGTGGATFAIVRKAGKMNQIIGMDLSSGQINVAKKGGHKSSIRFVEGDVSATGFEDGYFDKVFITHALHEMPREVRLKVLTEAKSILKEKGKVIILEVDNPESSIIRLFIGFWFFYWLPFNFETPTRKDMLKHGLTNEVKEAGFKSVRKISKYQGVFQIVEGEK
ncbi:MAG: methyltransferase domain-containing protein [candidate division Zixibacteria bacterium]|nr:methyltransferase domain-containing protein [candidate division Zixibacteria bacterium]